MYNNNEEDIEQGRAAVLLHRPVVKFEKGIMWSQCPACDGDHWTRMAVDGKIRECYTWTYVAPLLQIFLEPLTI